MKRYFNLRKLKTVGTWRSIMIERRLNNLTSYHVFFLLKNENNKKEFSKKSDEGFETKTKNKFTILFDIEPSKDRNVFLKLGENFTFKIDQECKIILTKNENYLGIESVWNHKNYWVNMQSCFDGTAGLQYDLGDCANWEYMLTSNEKPTLLLSNINDLEDEEVNN